MTPELKTAFGDPTHESGNDIEVHEVTLSSGTATLSYDHEYASAPKLIATGESGDAGWSARGTSQATITGSGSDTVFVLVIGERA